MTNTGPSLPLAGIKVLEFSQTVMGPCAGLLLADLGAEVIKVEPTPDGDPTRHTAGFGSGMYSTYNRNKRSLALDCKSPEGQAVLHKLLLDTDVVLENYAPGVMKRLGCDWETVHAINPRVIFLELKGFLSGPYEKRAALDEVVQYMGGLAYMTGPLGKPSRAGASVTDTTGALFGVSAVLAALYEREKTGKGRLVKSSLFESVAFMMGQFMAGILRQGEDMLPMPHRKSAWPVYDTFPTSNGEIVFISVTSDKQWWPFIAEFGLDHLGEDPRLDSHFKRMAQHDLIFPEVAAKVAQLTKAEVGAKCEKVGCGWAHVAKPADLWDDPQLNAGHMEEVELYGRKTVNDEPSLMVTRLPKIPLELDGQTLQARRQPPFLGEQTREILKETGMSDAEVDALIAAGKAVETASPKAT